MPSVVVEARPWERRHGGYLISGDFRVNPKLPYMVYPGQALTHGDVLSVQPVNLQDNEYLVLQECVTQRCDEAKIVRVWNTNGSIATAPQMHAGDRIMIPHENKYFIYLKRLPEVPFHPSCDACDTHFRSFALFSPPLTLIPNGLLSAHYQHELEKTDREPPQKVVSEKHEGATFVITFDGGSTVRIKRMRPDNDG
ncbi:hypothetical protein [Oleiagrimonas soli]|uniref:Uncharacterized protein n=1 Tax=Oleiagrimonas soli TaxID=1543381 RepID=A0A841KII4_9GAMM|nr:hypothetical protein [Oleiagrimonas soli]MBB6183579.1 hypothetical protein [Oleiagrimonas soli]